MGRLLKLLPIFLLAVLFVSCGSYSGKNDSLGSADVAGRLTADFNLISSGSLAVNLTDISLANGGAEIAVWLWDFGDNSTATTNNTTHRYATAGTYAVTLTIKDTNENESYISKLITLTSAGVSSLKFEKVFAGSTASHKLGITTDSKIYTTASHNFGTTADGKVYAWGWNVAGELGLGDRVSRNIPTEVKSLAGKGITLISLGCNYTIALASDGKVYTWGYNGYGQLGLGDRVNRNIPTEVKTLADKKISKIMAGSNHAVAMSSDGKVYTWGYNVDGKFWLIHFVNNLLPKQAIKADNNILKEGFGFQ